MATSFTGGCMCGAVRYEGAADPLIAANCHCRDCQKATGAAVPSFFAVPKSAIKTIGELKYYDCKAESGNTVSRGTCPKCGSRVMGTSTMMPDAVVIMAGSLDDPSWFRPMIDVWTSRAQPWNQMNPELPKFEKNPLM